MVIITPRQWYVNEKISKTVDRSAPMCYNFRMEKYQDIIGLSERFGINAEYAGEEFYPRFCRRTAGKDLLILCDANTGAYAHPFAQRLRELGRAVRVLELPAREPVADERTCASVEEAIAPNDYVLAVGAGTLNDIAKYATFRRGVSCGVLATAASMDGFTSGVTPLIKNGFKITENAHTVEDILIDFDILCAAPRIMTGAGTGDILAKYCCLSDWKMAALLTGEDYNEESASLMRVALEQCVKNIPDIAASEKKGIDALLRALLISGYAMVLAGSSRPASGAEHHMSHYLEMDFLRRGKPIPLHGIKVGLGTLVSLHMYRRLCEMPATFEGQESVVALAETLPSPEWAASVLESLGCPTRFSQIGVPKDTVRAMLFECYKIRDRFTIMTLYHRFNWMYDAADELLERYY